VLEPIVITRRITNIFAHTGMHFNKTSHEHAEHDAHAACQPLHAAEHLVQFYETDAFLLETLSSFIGTGLAAGDLCIVLATPEHRAGLDERLQAAGLDVPAAQPSGQFVGLDAAETLGILMVDGSPDPERFGAIFEPLLARARAEQRRVRVFGELVALLWAAEQYHAALDLEALWNDLHAAQAFMLFCAYPISGFRGAALAQPLHDVCAAHARVIPAESYTTLTAEDDRMRAIIQLQQQAQSLQAEIAERKATEQRLRQRERVLTDFFEHAPVALHGIDASGIILWANQTELDLLGYTEEEYIGRNIAEFHVDSDVIGDFLARLGRGEELHNYEARLRCKDGMQRHVLISSNVYREDGQFVHTRCFMRDITARLHADQQVQFQAQLLDCVEQAVIACNTAGVITYWNRFAERLYGWTAAEAVGRPVITVVVPETTPDRSEQMMNWFQDGTTWAGEYVMRRRDGTTFPAFLNAASIRDAHDQLVGIVGVSIDISAPRQIQADLQQALAEVHAARDQLQVLSRRLLDVQEAERRMLARELHDEIGQHLTGLSLQLLMIDPHDPAPALRSRVQAAQRQVSAIMAQVRTISLNLRPPMLDDLGLLAALEWHLQRYTEQTHIQVGFTHHGLAERRFGPEVEITAYRVVQEALTNVARHAGVNHATVQVWLDAEHLHVQIADQGRGFDPISMHYTSSGLSGMRERVQLLQGRLRLQTVPGAGTCVAATLPMPARAPDEENADGCADDCAGG
jgi:PAS domain S-box-containing protein